MREQRDVVGIVLQVREDLVRVGRAALQDAHEAQALVLPRGAEHVVEHDRVPVHDLRHEGHVGHAQGGGQGVERRQPRPAGVGVRLQTRGAGGRGLLLGQAVDVVVEQHRDHVHVVADGVDPVAGADAEAVTVTGGQPHIQVGPAGLDAHGHREGATELAGVAGGRPQGQPQVQGELQAQRAVGLGAQAHGRWTHRVRGGSSTVARRSSRDAASGALTSMSRCAGWMKPSSTACSTNWMMGW